MVGFILGSSILLPPGQQVEHEAWLAILGGLIESILFVGIYIGLVLRFPGKTLVEIAECVYGRILGGLVAAAFVGYLFHLGSFVVRNFLDFIHLTMLVETPPAVLLLVGLIICAYGAFSGAEALGRCAQVLVPLTIALIIFNTAFLMHEINMENLLPFFVAPVPKYLRAIHGAATFPFGEIVVFLMIAPYLNQKKKTPRTFLTGLLISGLILSFTSIRATIVLGNVGKIILYPNFYVSRLIHFGNVFTRTEIITATNFLVTGFIKIAVLIYGTSLGTAQLFHLPKYQSLVAPISVLMFLVALMNFSNVMENIEFALVVYPVYSLPFIVGIPLLTLIVAWLRKLPAKQGGR